MRELLAPERKSEFALCEHYTSADRCTIVAYHLINRYYFKVPAPKRLWDLLRANSFGLGSCAELEAANRIMTLHRDPAYRNLNLELGPSEALRLVRLAWRHKP